MKVKGFTIIEVIVVVITLAVAIMVVAPQMTRSYDVYDEQTINEGWD